MANIYFRCSCGKSLAVDEAGVGRTVNCPDCKQPVTIPAPDLELDCSCGSIILAPSDMAGQVVQCTDCGANTDIPVIEQTASEPIDASTPRVSVKIDASSNPLPAVNNPAHSCPTCKKQVHPNAVSCINCGYDFRIGNKFPSPTSSKPFNKTAVISIVAFSVLSLLLIPIILSINSKRKHQAVAISSNAVSIKNTFTNTQAKETASFEFFDSISKSKATAIFQNYEQCVKQGNWPKAVELFNSIKLCLTNETEYHDFIANIIPGNCQRTLRFYFPCYDCITGKCAACAGTGSCSQCPSDTTCQKCKGTGYNICSLCLGNGVCRSCNGNKYFQCNQCRGTGMGLQQSHNTTCPRCNGSGQHALISGYGKCLGCNGRGQISESYTPPCSSCNGKGKKACNECNGSGECHNCNGKGIIRSKCEACQGSGKTVCKVCNGIKTCASCGGTKLCSKCRGGLIFDAGSHLVSSAWMKYDHGYATYISSNLLVLTNIGSPVITISDKAFSLNIASNEFACISSNNSFDWVKGSITY